MSEVQKPSVGRIVHYQSFGTPGGEYLPKSRAAIITDEQTDNLSDPMTVSLCILNPTGQFFNTCVHYADPPKPGCWSWPPRT